MGIWKKKKKKKKKILGFWKNKNKKKILGIPKNKKNKNVKKNGKIQWFFGGFDGKLTKFRIYIDKSPFYLISCKKTPIFLNKIQHITQ